MFRIEKCLNSRIHIWFMGIKIWSWGPKTLKPYKNAKLGISYSVWDGEELLEQSIKQIRSVADYINVVWQKKSWHGQNCNPRLEKLLNNLKNKGLIDELIFFEPDLTKNPAYNEVNKRNIGLKAARRAGCTHFMTMDTDEFYITDQFRSAYNDIITRHLTHTYCNIVSYITPTIRYRDYENFFVSFIYEIKKYTKLQLGCYRSFCPLLVDPTRQIKLRKNSKFCFLGNIVMHHMKSVRTDIIKKVRNSSGNQSKNMYKDLLKTYVVSDMDLNKKLKSGECIKTTNEFGIQI